MGNKKRIHPWKCPNCGDDGAPVLKENLAVYECIECRVQIPIDEVGP